MSSNNNRNDDDRPEDDEVECQRSRESLRRNSCAGHLRRSRTCTCGRPRALTRHGHHWRRHETCRRCARASKTLVTLAARSPRKGGSHA
jgi:hypothetical protein